ncbi:MAG TPA: family 1 glycosylhydrolase, partial [Thermomicrobiales bacterium]|nr:family 1 glycosylhydrolase [Thermomicrobiales bacterium]
MNRVGDRFLDQMELSGHARRIEDLDQFAELGITAIRYPVLWERTAPEDPTSADWSWSDSRLARLRELGIRPIVGLVHHGSGPKGTDLLDPEFPALLARYAGAVAERYPWITEYTPVNEPLTTARFSALYGHWYPHHRDEGAFFRAVLIQCKGVAAAMRAIREVNPAARLIQTEDLGEVFARPVLAHQADYENERRWLSLDLLTGRVTPGHAMWQRLIDMGIAEADLRSLADVPCPPGIVGINHYVTSERLLDERLERYPESSHGGNGEQVYADIEAVRACVDGPGGWERLLRAAHERYGLPLAATEVHLGCSREEQLRWLYEVWSTARNLQA